MSVTIDSLNLKKFENGMTLLETFNVLYSTLNKLKFSVELVLSFKEKTYVQILSKLKQYQLSNSSISDISQVNTLDDFLELNKNANLPMFNLLTSIYLDKDFTDNLNFKDMPNANKLLINAMVSTVYQLYANKQMLCTVADKITQRLFQFEKNLKINEIKHSFANVHKQLKMNSFYKSSSLTSNHKPLFEVMGYYSQIMKCNLEKNFDKYKELCEKIFKNQLKTHNSDLSLRNSGQKAVPPIDLTSLSFDTSLVGQDIFNSEGLTTFTNTLNSLSSKRNFIQKNSILDFLNKDESDKVFGCKGGRSNDFSAVLNNSQGFNQNSLKTPNSPFIKNVTTNKKSTNDDDEYFSSMSSTSTTKKEKNKKQKILNKRNLIINLDTVDPNKPTEEFSSKINKIISDLTETIKEGYNYGSNNELSKKYKDKANEIFFELTTIMEQLNTFYKEVIEQMFKDSEFHDMSSYLENLGEFMDKDKKDLLSIKIHEDSAIIDLMVTNNIKYKILEKQKILYDVYEKQLARLEALSAKYMMYSQMKESIQALSYSQLKDQVSIFIHSFMPYDVFVYEVEEIIRTSGLTNILNLQNTFIQKNISCSINAFQMIPLEYFLFSLNSTDCFSTSGTNLKNNAQNSYNKLVEHVQNILLRLLYQARIDVGSFLTTPNSAGKTAFQTLNSSTNSLSSANASGDVKIVESPWKNEFSDTDFVFGLTNLLKSSKIQPLITNFVLYFLESFLFLTLMNTSNISLSSSIVLIDKLLNDLIDKFCIPIRYLIVRLLMVRIAFSDDFDIVDSVPGTAGSFKDRTMTFNIDSSPIFNMIDKLMKIDDFKLFASEKNVSIVKNQTNDTFSIDIKNVVASSGEDVNFTVKPEYFSSVRDEDLFNLQKFLIYSSTTDDGFFNKKKEPLDFTEVFDENDELHRLMVLQCCENFTMHIVKLQQVKKNDNFFCIKKLRAKAVENVVFNINNNVAFRTPPMTLSPPSSPVTRMQI